MEKTSHELEMQSPVDENRWLHVSSVPFQQDQKLIILRDNTDLHNVEQIRRDFVANISHELRTPVTVLLGYLELLQSNTSNNVSDAVERMYGQAVQMKALLDDLLQLSRLQSDEIQGEESVVDVPVMLQQLRLQLEEVSKDQHKLSFIIEPDLQLRGIEPDLKSAFRNLMINAVNYTPEKGEISVSWQSTDQGPCLMVKDSGIGIPARDLPRLTERFYRVSSSRARASGGTGLGLAIVKHVMHAHKANLHIHSELGEGSEFICQFGQERAVSGLSGPGLMKPEPALLK